MELKLDDTPWWEKESGEWERLPSELVLVACLLLFFRLVWWIVNL